MNLSLEKPQQPNHHLLVLFNPIQVNLVNLVNPIRVNIKLDTFPPDILVSHIPANLVNHTLDNLCRATFPKVNSSRAIRQDTNQTLHKAIQLN